MVNGINWDQVMADKRPFNDLAFRRKEDARDYPNSLEFGFARASNFPRASTLANRFR